MNPTRNPTRRNALRGVRYVQGKPAHCLSEFDLSRKLDVKLREVLPGLLVPISKLLGTSRAGYVTYYFQVLVIQHDG